MNALKATAQGSYSLITAICVLLASFHVEAAPPVQVTAADPSSAPQGTVNLEVAVSGSGFDSSAAVSFLVTGTTNPGGITVKSVRYIGPKKLLATIDVADTATVAQFDIEVQLTGGRKGKGTSLFAVQSKSAAAINPAFAVDPNQQYKDKVTRLMADGSGVTVLTGPLISSPKPRWSPDGRSIAYFDRLALLFVRMNSRSGAVEATMPLESHNFNEFDWSNGNVDACGDLIAYSARQDDTENDLYVTDASLLQSKRLVMSHDLDDISIGSAGDPSTHFPAWSPDGRYVAAHTEYWPETGPATRALFLYSVSCTKGVDVTVDSEIELSLSLGMTDYWWNGFTWSANGRYLAMTVHDSSDGNLWIADLGDPGQPGYPDSTPVLYRLTGAGRPFGGGSERITSAAFAPAASTIAFVTQGTRLDRDDSLYTINADMCIAAISGSDSISTGCAVTLVSKGINAHNIDWRPNWPTPLQ